MNKIDIKKLSYLKSELISCKNEVDKIKILAQINEIQNKYILRPETKINLSDYHNQSNQIRSKLKDRIFLLWGIYNELKTPRYKKYIAHLVYKCEEELNSFKV